MDGSPGTLATGADGREDRRLNFYSRRDNLRISVFYGIVITMYFYDHEPPYFHAQYAEHHAVIVIETGALLVGELPSRALMLVSEWATLHRPELEANWGRAKDGGAPEPIDPLP